MNKLESFKKLLSKKRQKHLEELVASSHSEKIPSDTPPVQSSNAEVQQMLEEMRQR